MNDGLRELGGHVGHDVLLTCAPEDHASRRVVERDGGRLVDTSAAGRLRSTWSSGAARPC